MPQHVQFIIGEGFDRFGVHLADVTSKEQTAYRLVADAFTGYSAAHLDGGWVSNNRLIAEPSLAISVFAQDYDLPKVPQVAESLRALFNQESVIVARSPLASLEYVNAESHESRPLTLAA